jgi:hypothetical protein
MHSVFPILFLVLHIMLQIGRQVLSMYHWRYLMQRIIPNNDVEIVDAI